MSSTDFLNLVSLQWSIYTGIIVLVLGILGNLFNIVVFLSLKTFRENSCAFYLMTMSFLNLGQLLVSLLPRVMNLWFSIDWAAGSLVYCKFRVFCFQVCSLASLACMCLATIDQYLTTSTHVYWQHYGTIKYARIFFSISLFIWILHGIPTIIFYGDVNSPTTGGITCAIINPVFQNYNTYGFTLILLTSLPILVTVVFGSLAYRNVTQLAYRAVPLVRRELDKQLTVMVLVQVVYNFCNVVPYTVVYILGLSITASRSSYSYAQVQLARSITLTFFYLYFASPFYIYVCVSERFRKQFIYVIYGIYLKRQMRRGMVNQVIPTD